MEDPDKFLVPGSYLVLIALRKDEPEDRIPFALLVDLPLYIEHGPAIDASVE